MRTTCASGLGSFDAYRKDIFKRMKQKDLPQVDLFLVVNMFLTGFDSKPTNMLVLDKNLVWHSLVQAHSRTNRADRVTKQFGQIVTYRNIKKAQDAALKLRRRGSEHVSAPVLRLLHDEILRAGGHAEARRGNVRRC